MLLGIIRGFHARLPEPCIASCPGHLQVHLSTFVFGTTRSCFINFLPPNSTTYHGIVDSRHKYCTGYLQLGDDSRTHYLPKFLYLFADQNTEVAILAQHPDRAYTYSLLIAPLEQSGHREPSVLEHLFGQIFHIRAYMFCASAIKWSNAGLHVIAYGINPLFV